MRTRHLEIKAVLKYNLPWWDDEAALHYLKRQVDLKYEGEGYQASINVTEWKFVKEEGQGR